MSNFPVPEKMQAVYDAYPESVKDRLLFLRELIYETALANSVVGPLEETLKWGQPSFLTSRSKSGTTIRLDQIKSSNGSCGLYFHCQTDLVDRFRALYPEIMTYEGNRCILFYAEDDIPVQALKHCLAMALTYHHDKKTNQSS
ncbi:DUF1801 domain-containing protein [Kiloniella laminariae]|uniref:DUF1801 domain-containing protein n=1 Tax=Kiloniella laminariae TaxID=454162 RepID=A0ABT4LNT6_9PROT|nr:DUF1801 domain-containing protein [Kiloniella laminariae]MCZ4282761.1 DUF1801 domain-containing protein [Kiloniella laminariae]